MSPQHNVYTKLPVMINVNNISNEGSDYNYLCILIINIQENSGPSMTWHNYVDDIYHNEKFHMIHYEWTKYVMYTISSRSLRLKFI